MTKTATLNDAARAGCAAGDYDAIAEEIWDVRPRIVCRLGVTPGEDVLDVACAPVTPRSGPRKRARGPVGVDPAPELFAVARKRGGAGRGRGRLVHSDAEVLPFADSSFDVVVRRSGRCSPPATTSCRRLARVLRPDCQLGVVQLDARRQRRRVLSPL